MTIRTTTKPRKSYRRQRLRRANPDFDENVNELAWSGDHTMGVGK